MFLLLTLPPPDSSLRVFRNIPHVRQHLLGSLETGCRLTRELVQHEGGTLLVNLPNTPDPEYRIPAGLWLTLKSSKLKAP